MALDPYARALYDRVGGKAGVFLGIHELGLPIPTGPYAIKRHGQKLDEVIHLIDGMPTPLVARPSHRNDFYGLFGAIDTVKGIEDEAGLRRAIARIELQAADPQRQAFFAAFDEVLDEEVHVLITPQWPQDWQTGLAMRRADGNMLVNLRYHDKSMKHVPLQVYYDPPYHDWFPDEVAAWVQLLHESKLADPGWLPLIEFGCDNAKEYLFGQLKAGILPTFSDIKLDKDAFLTIEHGVGAVAPGYESPDAHVYGVSDGIDVTCILSDPDRLSAHLREVDGPVMVHVDDTIGGAPHFRDLDPEYARVRVVVRESPDHSYLEHELMRPFRNADVAANVLNGEVLKERLVPFEPGRRYNVRSNGRKVLVEPI